VPFVVIILIPPVLNAYHRRRRPVTLRYHTALHPEPVIAYYQARLRTDGWADGSKDVETARASARGFRFADPPRRMACLICRGEQGPAPYGSLSLPRATRPRRSTWRWT